LEGPIFCASCSSERSGRPRSTSLSDIGRLSRQTTCREMAGRCLPRYPPAGSFNGRVCVRDCQCSSTISFSI
jgi:hypothetical protein